MKLTALALSLALAGAIANPAAAQVLRKQPFLWDNATIYLLLTDRFNKGSPANDHAGGHKDDAATLRGFMGGDLADITAKIRAGYFTNLGVDAI